MKYRCHRLANGKEVQFDENGLELYRLPCGTAVITTKGPGTIAGGNDQEVFVVLNADILEGTVTVFPIEEIGSGVVLEGFSPIVPSHPLKTIVFRGRTVRIVTQTTQGPCPIFAVANALALQGKVQLNPDDGAEKIREPTLNSVLCEYFRSLTWSLIAKDSAWPPMTTPLENATDDSRDAGVSVNKTSEALSPSTPSTAGNSSLAHLVQDRARGFQDPSSTDPPCSGVLSLGVLDLPTFSTTPLEGKTSVTPGALPCATPVKNYISEKVLPPHSLSIPLPDVQKEKVKSLETTKDEITTSEKSTKSSPTNTFEGGEQESSQCNPTQRLPQLKNLRETRLHAFLQSGEFMTVRRQIAEADPSSPNSIEGLLSRLYSGMDLDPVFSGVEVFTLDDKVIFFALFGLRVYHGWVIGERMKLFRKLQNLSYNDLTTLMVSTPDAENPPFGVQFPTGDDDENGLHPTLSPMVDCDGELPISNCGSSTWDPTAEGEDGWFPGTAESRIIPMISMKELAREFFSRTAGIQLTEDGYNQLLECFPEEDIGVFFCENHFYTLTRMEDRLLVLLTVDWYRKIDTYVFEVVSFSSPHSDYCNSAGEVIDKYAAYMASEGDNAATGHLRYQTLTGEGKERMGTKEVLNLEQEQKDAKVPLIQGVVDRSFRDGGDTRQPIQGSVVKVPSHLQTQI